MELTLNSFLQFLYLYHFQVRKKPLKRAIKLEGEVDKGNIIQLAILAVDSMKVDRGCLIYVIINKIIYKKNASSYYVVYKGSIIKGIIQQHLLTKLPKATLELMRLKDIKEIWTSHQCISIHEAIVNISLIGG